MRKRWIVILPLLLFGTLICARLAFARPLAPAPYWQAKNGTIVLRTTHYTVCGHKGSTTSLIEPRLIGLDASALARVFSNWTIARTAERRVELERVIDAYCPRHFLLKEKEGHLAVYQNATGEGQWTLIRELDVSPGSLALTLRAELVQGRVFSSMEEIEHTLSQ